MEFQFRKYVPVIVIIALLIIIILLLQRRPEEVVLKAVNKTSNEAIDIAIDKLQKRLINSTDSTNFQRARPEEEQERMQTQEVIIQGRGGGGPCPPPEKECRTVFWLREGQEPTPESGTEAAREEAAPESEAQPEKPNEGKIIGEFRFNWKEAEFSEFVIYFNDYTAMIDRLTVDPLDTAQITPLSPEERSFYTPLFKRLYGSALSFLEAEENAGDENIRVSQNYSYTIDSHQTMQVDVSLSITSSEYRLTEKVNYPGASDVTRK